MAKILSTLNAVTQWPLWSCKKKIYGDQVWIFIDEVPPLWMKPDGFRRALEELRRLQHTCIEEGIVGWVGSVDFDNVRMLRALEIFKAKRYAHDHDGIYYMKHLYNSPLPKTVREGIREWRQGRVGTD